jgi:hypothetical protein
MIATSNSLHSCSRKVLVFNPLKVNVQKNLFFFFIDFAFSVKLYAQCQRKFTSVFPFGVVVGIIDSKEVTKNLCKLRGRE